MSRSHDDSKRTRWEQSINYDAFRAEKQARKATTCWWLSSYYTHYITHCPFFDQDDKTNIYAQSIKAGDFNHPFRHSSLYPLTHWPIHPKDVLNRRRRNGAYFVGTSTPANVSPCPRPSMLRILRVLAPS